MSITDGDILDCIDEIVGEWGLDMTLLCTSYVCDTLGYAFETVLDEDDEERVRLILKDYLRNMREMLVD